MSSDARMPVTGQVQPAPDGISVVVPVFNSVSTLQTLTERIATALASQGVPYEIILVNDGSRDDSWRTILGLSHRYAMLRGFDLMRNYGQHNALLAGIRAARYPIIVTIDDDLQHPPEEIPALIGKLAEGYDVVYGTAIDERHGLWRDLASQLTKIALRSAMGVETARKVSALRAFRTQTRDAFVNYKGPFVSIDVLLTWGSTRFAALPVRHEQRAEGRSHYSFGMLLTHAVDMMTGFSTLPLQLASLMGFAFTAFGGVVLAFVIGRYLVEGGSVPGFPFLASTIAIFSGAQLFAIGIIGEYLARMHFRMMERPTYTVRGCTDGDTCG